MCQIIFSPDGRLCSKADFWEANNDNNDGIGVMSAAGVQKFFGKRQVRRAWAYVQLLADVKYPWAAHFRYGTAGLRDRSNVHPFTSACGVHWMHNGVMRAAALYDPLNERSDTALFVDTLGGVTDPAKVVDLLEMAIGQGNKLLAYAPALDSWTIFNESLGEWDDGLWFSNEYSRANWASKYSGYGSRYNSTSNGGSLTGYLYDADTHEIADLYADGSRGPQRPLSAADAERAHKGYAGGTTSDGKQIVVLDGCKLPSKPYTAAQVNSLAVIAASKVPDTERMALMQNTRSDSAVKERVNTCSVCSGMELKRCYCTSAKATELDIALDVLDSRLSLERDDDALGTGAVSLSDPSLIQQRIDAYLRDEEDERANMILDEVSNA